MKNKKFYFTLFISLFSAFLLGIFIFMSVRENNKVNAQYVTYTENLAAQQKQNVIDKYGTEGLIETEISDSTPTQGTYAEDEYTEYVTQHTETPYTENIEVTAENGFRFIVLDVGQASCNIIECDGHYMIFDGGDRGTSSYVVSYAQKTLGIKSFDYVIASHYDADHIAGLIGIMQKFKVGTVFGPPYETDTKTFYSFKSSASRFGGIKYPSVGETYTLGSATFSVVSPLYTYADENSNSLGIEITYGDTRCLVMGDATVETEYDCLNNGYIRPVDILILNHHGSASSTCEQFISVTQPQIIAISVGAGNDYGHPAPSVLETIAEYPVLRTDESGTIIFVSDGKNIDIFTER